jgi:hypothetical protein
MDTITLSFRDHATVRLAMRAGVPVVRNRMRPIAPANMAGGHTALTCHWQRNLLTGRLEGRWARERNTVSEEGVSRSFGYALAA